MNLPDCQEHRKKINDDIDTLFDMAIPAWCRAAIFGALGLLFFCFFISVIYAHTTFQTRAEAAANQERIEKMFQEIRCDVKELLRFKK